MGVDQAKLTTAPSGQVAYDGHLLYEFAGDATPGDTNGTKIASWYAVSPTGDAIEQGEDDEDATTTTAAAAAERSGY